MMSKTEPTTPAPISEQTLQRTADGIRRQYHKAVAHVIKTAHMLVTARDKLPRDDFERMFHDHARPIANPLPFGLRAAQMYMAIAKQPILLDANHGSSLPASYRTLYELSRLPSKTLLKGLADGRVHPEMERHDVLRLRDGSAKATAARLGPRERAEVRREIVSTVRGLWTRFPQEHKFLVEEVQALAQGSLPGIDDANDETPEDLEAR